jgi:hypothetical protein
MRSTQSPAYYPSLRWCWKGQLFRSHIRWRANSGHWRGMS